MTTKEEVLQRFIFERYRHSHLLMGIDSGAWEDTGIIHERSPCEFRDNVLMNAMFGKVIRERVTSQETTKEKDVKSDGQEPNETPLSQANLGKKSTNSELFLSLQKGEDKEKYEILVDKTRAESKGKYCIKFGCTNKARRGGFCAKHRKKKVCGWYEGYRGEHAYTYRFDFGPKTIKNYDPNTQGEDSDYQFTSECESDNEADYLYEQPSTNCIVEKDDQTPDSEVVMEERPINRGCIVYYCDDVVFNKTLSLCRKHYRKV